MMIGMIVEVPSLCGGIFLSAYQLGYHPDLVEAGLRGFDKAPLETEVSVRKYAVRLVRGDTSQGGGGS